jgi:nitrate/TMAO reductase-like tetraheme cytochrome c subunit
MFTSRKLLLPLLFGVPFVAIFFWRGNIFDSPKPDPRGTAYAGETTCISCHKDVYNDYLHSAHLNTSRPADEHSITGTFVPGHNIYAYDKDVKVVMEKRDSGLFQVAYADGKVVDEHRFDISIGGVKAQSYLYWAGNSLFQLPVSHFAALKSWANSPGYRSDKPDFTRPVGADCMSCHASYMQRIPNNQPLQHGEEFDKTALILGIDCERCHGPAAQHVDYQTDHPEDKKARFIAVYANLPRAVKMDMCAICHSGASGMMLRPSFAFKPGDRVADFRLAGLFQNTDPNQLDVHGNQYQLLSNSKCFINSNMDCATCHNVHANQRGQIALYSQKCISCHQQISHKFINMTPAVAAAIKTNCIDCHMPERSSNAIALNTAQKNEVLPYMVRTHHIAVYPDVTQAMVNKLGLKGK